MTTSKRGWQYITVGFNGLFFCIIGPLVYFHYKHSTRAAVGYILLGIFITILVKMTFDRWSLFRLGFLLILSALYGLSLGVAF